MADVNIDNLRTLAQFINELCEDFDVCSKCPVAESCISERDCVRALIWHSVGNPTKEIPRRF